MAMLLILVTSLERAFLMKDIGATSVMKVDSTETSRIPVTTVSDRDGQSPQTGYSYIQKRLGLYFLLEYHDLAISFKCS
ncbi:hypothetical protein GOP47_0003579 [Adiantum capillus-veneris]|uniref:Uncharacterized protein n=1 Tax=Adiantum capillus-veneris TaxID=13818 RepID=A0A9D4ZNY2_ADICA|nr:hypothetical protein GOP47_0003579 [Adiantum capillus-veneris]